MSIAQHPTRYFEDDKDYILGDSAYPLSNYLIRPFTQAVLKKSGTDAQRAFNVMLSSTRVNVEHAIGRLKLRFPILRNITMVVGTEQDNKRVVDLIRTLCTLHNFCLDQNDEWELDAADRRLLNEWMDAAFEDLQDSEWSDIARRGATERWATEESKHAGELKRKWLVEFLDRRTPASVKKPFWWRD
jgi:DDE superfamily endonuclease